MHLRVSFPLLGLVGVVGVHLFEEHDVPIDVEPDTAPPGTSACDCDSPARCG